MFFDTHEQLINDNLQESWRKISFSFSFREWQEQDYFYFDPLHQVTY